MTALKHIIPAHFRALFISLILLFSLNCRVATQSSPTCPHVESCLPLLRSSKPCPLFPLLPGGAAPLPGPSGYVLTTIADGVYHYSDDAYHSVIVYSSTTKHLAVIDFPRSANSFPPSSPEYLLVSAVRSITGDFSNVRRLSMIYSHRHLDHIGSASIFMSPFLNTSNTKVSIYGTLESRKYLSRLENRPVPLPAKIIPKTSVMTVKVDSKLMIKLQILGGHTRSDVVSHIPYRNKANGQLQTFVHFVDIITPGEAPFADFVFTLDLARYIRVHEELLKMDFQILSTGHGKLGSKQDVVRNLEFTRFVIKTIQQAAATVNPSQILGRINNPSDVAYRNGAWAFFEIIKLQVGQCVESVIKEWGCKLSVVDVFVETLCQTAAFYVLAEL